MSLFEYIGIAASIIAIIVFITGKNSFSEISNSIKETTWVKIFIIFSFVSFVLLLLYGISHIILGGLFNILFGSVFLVFSCGLAAGFIFLIREYPTIKALEDLDDRGGGE